MTEVKLPLVSTVLCTYNQGEYIREAAESVLAQTYQNIELVVIDNGSTDSTAELLRGYEADGRVRLLLHPENGPVTKRLNDGVAASRGEFVSILYGDDYYLPEKFERQVACFAGLDESYGVVYGPGYRLDAKTGGRWLDPSLRASGLVLKEMLLNHAAGPVNPISPLMRRACFERFPYRENLFVEGEAINLRFATAFKYAFLDEPLVVMREHERNIGKAVKANVERLMIALDRLVEEQGFPPDCRRAVETFRARVLRDSAWQGVRVMCDPRWARRCFGRALAVQWEQAVHPRVLLGLPLTLLPPGALRTLNGAVQGLVRRRGYSVHVDRPELMPGLEAVGGRRA
jgi:glycosyltransferase involved in cell wall biosynthesis